MSKRLETGEPPTGNSSCNDPLLQKGFVQDVCRQWLVHEDSAFANRLQEDEFERKYNRNLVERQLARQDVRLARQVQNVDDKLEQRTRQQRMWNIVDDEDAIIAERLQSEEIIRKEHEQIISELKDEEMARRLQEREKRRYELRMREKELRKQQKRIETDLRHESNDILENSIASRIADVAISELAEERRSCDIDVEAGNDLDFFVSSSEKRSRHVQEELQQLQDKEFARLLQNKEQQHLSKSNKLKEIERKDAELAKIIQEEEKQKMRRQDRNQRHRESRQAANPRHVTEFSLLEGKQSHSVPRSLEMPANKDVSQGQGGLHDQVHARTNHPSKLPHLQPSTPSHEPPWGCSALLTGTPEKNSGKELFAVRPTDALPSCHGQVPSDNDKGPSSPSAPLPASKPSPSTSANIFTAIDPTWNQGQGRHYPDAHGPSPERPFQAGAFELGDSEDGRTLHAVVKCHSEDVGMVPGQRRQPFSRSTTRASGHKSNCKHQ